MEKILKKEYIIMYIFRYIHIYIYILGYIHIYICMSLWCTPETHSIVNQLHLNFKNVLCKQSLSPLLVMFDDFYSYLKQIFTFDDWIKSNLRAEKVLPLILTGKKRQQSKPAFMISLVKSNWHWDLHFNMINWLAKDLCLVLSIFYHFIDQHLKNALLSSKRISFIISLIRANYLLTEKIFWYYFLFSKRSLRLVCFHIFPLIIYSVLLWLVNCSY